MFKEFVSQEPDLTERLMRFTQKPIRCKHCGEGITDDTKRLTVNGQHVHTGTNPAGILFVFSCFMEATGCYTAGEYTSEHTWFPRYQWSLAFCGRCQRHLGWHFRSAATKDTFFGLIQDRLTGL